MLSKISQNSHENTCAKASFSIKLQEGPCNFIKQEAPAQMLSFECFGIFKNIFFYRTPVVVASLILGIDSNGNCVKSVRIKFFLVRIFLYSEIFEAFGHFSRSGFYRSISIRYTVGPSKLFKNIFNWLFLVDSKTQSPIIL